MVTPIYKNQWQRQSKNKAGFWLLYRDRYGMNVVYELTRYIGYDTEANKEQ